MPREPGSRLLAFADAIFGRGDHESAAPRRWLLRYLGVAALLATVVAARRLDAVTNPQFWGEDGFLFFRDNLTLGFVRAAESFYMGFPHLGPRLVAFIGGLVPFAAAPRVYTTATIAATALGLASFALPGFRHLVRGDALRVLWCVAAASLPLEEQMPPIQWGGGLSTPSNLGWWVAIWLSLLSFIRLPPERWRVVLLALGGCTAIFTTPLAPVNAPLWLLRAWRGYRRSNRRELGFSLALVAALALCVAVTENLGSNAKMGIRLSFFDQPSGYLLRFVNLLTDRVAALILAPGALAAVRTAGTAAVADVALAALVALVVASLPGRDGNLPGLLAALYLFVAMLLLTSLGRLLWALLPLQNFPARFTIPPAAMLVLAVVIALDGLPRGWLRGLLILGITALLVWSWRPRFVVRPFVDQRWPQYAALLDQKLKVGSSAPLYIPMNPPWTPLKFDVRELSPEIHVPGSQVVGSLGSSGTFRQTFVSRCDGLDGVLLLLAAAAASSQGALELSLVDDQRQETVASVTMPRGLILPDGPQPFYFAPIKASAGRRYTIVLRAVQNDSKAAVSVLGAANDPYPEGKAVIGSRTDLDASFGYSCARERTDLGVAAKR